MKTNLSLAVFTVMVLSLFNSCTKKTGDACFNMSTADTFTWSKTIGNNRFEGRGEISRVNTKTILDLFVDEFIGSVTTKNQIIRYHGELQ